MSAAAPEPPAPTTSPEQGQRGTREPGPVLAQLSAALGNPDMKALEWSKNGRDVLVHVALYKEEMGKNKELFPELAELGCVTALQAWLLAYGFKLKGAKVKAQVLLLQHPDFQRARPTAAEPGALGGDAGPSAKQQKKSKKKKRARSLRPCRGAKSQDTLGQPRRLRPLYQYINFDMPEMMHPSAEEDAVPEPAQPSRVPAALGRAVAPQPEDTRASSAPDIPAPGEGDKFLQVDIDRMLRYTAHLVLPLFPQYQ